MYMYMDASSSLIIRVYSTLCKYTHLHDCFADTPIYMNMYIYVFKYIYKCCMYIYTYMYTYVYAYERSFFMFNVGSRHAWQAHLYTSVLKMCLYVSMYWYVDL